MRVWDKRSDFVVHEQEPFNGEAPPAALTGHALTPTPAFYSRNHGPIPQIDPDAWRLAVDGLVDRPATYALADLRAAFREVAVTATLQCAGNRRRELQDVRDIPGEHPWGPAATSTAEWHGIRLAELLAAAGVRHGATDVGFSGPDVSPLADPPQAFGGSVPLFKAQAPEVLLAWSMNGEPLEPAHGAPLRVVVPGYIGARSVKWLDRITVSDRPSDNFFQSVAYRLLPPEGAPAPGVGVPLGAVAVNSAILTPSDGAEVAVGRVHVAGYALAGDDRRVVRVDVSADGGRSWRQAELAEPLSPWTWRQWGIDLDVPAGTTEILARAWDSSAALQPARPEHVWNPKGYVNNSWARVTVRAV